MKQIYAYILLFFFTGFLVSISANFSLYVKFLNAGKVVEDINSLPEEHNENSSVETHFRNHLFSADNACLNYCTSIIDHNDTHRFSPVENPYFDVPHSPPKRS